MNEDSREWEDQAGSSTEEDDQSPSLQLLRERRSLSMSKSGEGMYLSICVQINYLVINDVVAVNHTVHFIPTFKSVFMLCFTYPVP